MKTKTLIKRLTVWTIIVGGILAIPAISRAPWTWGDYVLAWTILLGAASLFEVISEKISSKKIRILVSGVILLGVVAFWAWAVAG